MTREISREEILAMPAGRELDCLIAEKVMGWTRDFQCWKDENGRIRTIEPTSFGSFQPSEDISAAWEVVEKVKQSNWFFILSDNLFPDQWEASFFWDPNGTMIEARATTAPLAICRAALLVAMEETP